MAFPNLTEWQAKLDTLLVQMDALTGALRDFPRGDQQHSKANREWEPFVLLDGGTTSAAGLATIGGQGSNLIPAATGWEAYVHRVAVTVQGASSAATVANYHGEVGDQNLFDWSAGMFGNTPSRVVADYSSPVFFTQGSPLTVVVTGAVATQGVVIRVEGRRRQV